MTLVHELSTYKPLSWIFELVATDEHTVFLDSSSVGDLGRYSILGMNPYLILEETDDVLTRNGRPAEESIEVALSAELASRYEENTTPLPIICGAIGYFSYDFGRKFEQLPSRHPRTDSMPDAQFIFYDVLFVEDHTNQCLFVCIAGERTPIGTLLAKAEKLVARAHPPTLPVKHTGRALYEADFNQVDYEAAIRSLIEHIERGDTYIANMTQRLRINSDRHPLDVYRYLRTHNPSPFSCYMNGGRWHVCCTSMERFVRVHNRHITTRPIKGTRPRGSTPAEDEAMRRELEGSEKDRSELLMVVDLERNDVNRICETGSVTVPEHCTIERYATVFHLVSTVTGRLRDDVTVEQLIEATFPGGSITGAPKIRTMRIIDDLERSRRGLYTGSIGWFGTDGDCDLNIVIRTAIYNGEHYTVGVGGGITYESDPTYEHSETLLKAHALLEALYCEEEA